MEYWVARGKSISTTRGMMGEGTAIAVADIGTNGGQARLDELVERGVLVQANSAEEAARIVPAGGPKRLVGAARATGGPEQRAANDAMQNAQAASRKVAEAQAHLATATAGGDSAVIEAAQTALEAAQVVAQDATAESIRLAGEANQAN